MPGTVGEILGRGLREDPDREALVTRSGRYAYRELDELARRAVSALWALGVRPGDRVAVSLPNDTDVVVAFHGIMRLGAVWVGVNRNLAPPEKQWLLDDSDAGLLLDDDMLAEWTDALTEAEPVGAPAVDPHAPAGIAYTSGTTGRPKGAVHSQHNLLLPGAALVASRGYGPELRKGDCFPLTILNLQVLTTLLTAQAGGCAVIMDRIDAEGVAEWIQRERVTTWNGPPALLHSMVERRDIAAPALASLDEVWTGGADCPEQLRARFEAKVGTPVTATYGLSEAPAVVTIDDRGGGHRDGASGRPLPHLTIRIVDDSGAPAPVGEPGEICVGPVEGGPWAGAYRPMLGYLGRSEATAATLDGGLLRTGDIGSVDADGYLTVRDRKSLVVIRGGANVYPAEVERVLGAAPGVAACAVVGLPDERLGERVAAVVEPRPGETPDPEVLTAHCLAELARYKVPERFVLVDRLARNAMGKIDRNGVRDLFG
jgi:long-chain acyl-CoA synthetase